jgi:hypothetical protein
LQAFGIHASIDKSAAQLGLGIPAVWRNRQAIMKEQKVVGPVNVLGRQRDTQEAGQHYCRQHLSGWQPEDNRVANVKASHTQCNN